MRIISTGAAAMRHSALAVVEAVLVAAIVAALLLALSPVYEPADFLAGTESAQAAKGGNAASGSGGTGGSLTLVMVEDADGNGAPNHGDTITFDLSINADKPYVNVRCYQGSTFVYDAWVGYYDGAWFAQSFTLSSSYWLSGAADCTARLVTWSKNGRERTHATMNFHVDA